jgi:hypothetical protein
MTAREQHTWAAFSGFAVIAAILIAALMVWL